MPPYLKTETQVVPSLSFWGVLLFSFVLEWWWRVFCGTASFFVLRVLFCLGLFDRCNWCENIGCCIFFSAGVGGCMLVVGFAAVLCLQLRLQLGGGWWRVWFTRCQAAETAAYSSQS
jgi:hypothetical protein